ncbi:hypothetical protein [Streptomyces noursei]|uniref:hypothetical protein n=1 Tax=Streptomyces noursei TaxID=1971 RepID=UPI0015E08914|nr:hypothetical protein [Streptomyces noursei]
MSQELDEEVVRDRCLGFAPADPARPAALAERVREEDTPQEDVLLAGMWGRALPGRS